MSAPGFLRIFFTCTISIAVATRVAMKSEMGYALQTPSSPIIGGRSKSSGIMKMIWRVSERKTAFPAIPSD